MRTYLITSNAGVNMGCYVAESEADALDAMAIDAGYASQADAAEVAGPFEGTVTPLTYRIIVGEKGNEQGHVTDGIESEGGACVLLAAALQPYKGDGWGRIEFSANGTDWERLTDRAR